MIEVLDFQTVTPEWWITVIKGMRHPLKSYAFSDTTICSDVEPKEECDNCLYAKELTLNHKTIKDCYNFDYDRTVVFGKKDLNLMKNLIKAGPADRKFLRQVPVIFNINAPEYWWRQMDQYKIGTTTNSSSQMHRLAKDGVTLNDFSLDDTDNVEDLKPLIDKINYYLFMFNETKEEKYFRAALQRIPQSFNYTKTWTGTYENLRNMYQQRHDHKLKEWRDLCDWIILKVPFAEELILS